ncbi:MAG: ERCC4 domain-containing protein [Solidesulfovibrio sp.]|uniref:ERCC4 domain-containing protein n=1 Tax=Solidesulfovibrio sp. TaxID=2910990 RepID=UPI002B220EAD|nr:ERCC4 domain-containing protein [Solidesulfovibrio sp.]MEA4856108.1 ERCC4 domain-containing protein [Solidesulfovibrio sp.]
MIIAVDNREQLAYSFGGYDCSVEAATLNVGDYSIVGFEDKIACERKSIDDLIGCLTSGRERFEKELTRARSLDRFCVIVEASFEELAKGLYRSAMKPHAACQSVIAWQVRYGTPFVFAGSRKAAEYYCFSFLQKYVREIEERMKALTKSQAPTKSAAA